MQDELSEREIATALLESMVRGLGGTLSIAQSQKLTSIALASANTIVCETPAGQPGNRREWPSE